MKWTKLPIYVTLYILSMQWNWETMKTRVPLFIALLLLIVTSNLIVAQDHQTCPGGEITTTYEAPPPGLARYQVISFDVNCNQIVGPVLTVPIDELPQNVFDPDAKHGRFEPIVSEGVDTRAWRAYYRAYYVENSIYDIVHIKLNSVYSDIGFGYNGTSITEFYSGGGYEAHTENISCGIGWTAYNPENIIKDIGVGNSYIKFKQQASFSYVGDFDCSGTMYNNKLKNFPKVYGNGNATCTFSNKYRLWSLLWHWITLCL